MSTGLQEFLSSSAESSANREAAFLLLAGRLARGEDVPVKTIRTIVTSAERSPEDLAAEVEKARALVQAADEIERARAVLVGSVARIQRQAAVIEQITAEESAIVARIVELEAKRFNLNRVTSTISAELTNAESTDRSARRLLEADAGQHGIDVPAELPSRPRTPDGLQAAIRRKEFDGLCSGPIMARIAIERRKPLGADDIPQEIPAPVEPPAEEPEPVAQAEAESTVPQELLLT